MKQHFYIIEVTQTHLKRKSYLQFIQGEVSYDSYYSLGKLNHATKYTNFKEVKKVIVDLHKDIPNVKTVTILQYSLFSIMRV